MAVKRINEDGISLTFFMASFLYSVCSLRLSTKRCFKTVEKSKLLGVWTVGVSGTQTVHKCILVKLNCSVFTDFFFL